MAKKPIEVEALKHDAASRKNIPTAEFESVMREEDKSPVRLAYERRNRDLDPQLVWRGKDEQDWSELVVQAPPLYIQEKVHPKVIIDDLKQESRRRAEEVSPAAPDLFADFNGLKDLEAKTEFYQHDQHWSNRMICGDSLSVMASLAEREGLRGKVQCIYFDPPYGIKFNSNFQWSTTSRDVKDGDKSQVTREPEQVRAFRDTWRDGVHSYLTYLRDRLTVARDLLHESGSIFVQIGDENVHRVRALMDEVFGEDNFVVEIALSKATGLTSQLLASTFDFILWYSRHKPATKFRQLYRPKPIDEELRGEYRWLDESGVHVRRITDMELSGTHDLDLARVFKTNSAVSPGVRANTTGKFSHQGQTFDSGPQKNWKTTMAGMIRLRKANRLLPQPASIRIYKQFWCDFDRLPINNTWFDIRSEQNRIYVVQTVEKAIARCILMSTDPGDLVLDPTCGSGTTAYVCEHWGRRWITIDTSRVAVALARSRLMGARYPYYLLADSSEGQRKEGEVSRTPPKSAPTRGDIRHGFVYDRVPHIMLSDIAKNAEIDVIWEKWQETLEPLRTSLDKALSQKWEEWEIPREDGEPWDAGATHAFYIAMNTDRSLDERNAALRVIVHNTRKNFTLETLPKKPRCPWPDEPTRLHREWWEARIARQKEIDASIASRAKAEYLYDKPYIDKDRIRVAGPFTVESLSPHRTLAVDWDDELIDTLEASEGKRAASTRDEAGADFAQMILENLRAAGVQQAHKEDRIVFTSLVAGRAIRAISSAPKAASWRARRKSAPVFSSARNSGRSPVPTSSTLRARPATPASTC
jgi:adenine-specific DNA-methyltransferase